MLSDASSFQKWLEKNMMFSLVKNMYEASEWSYNIFFTRKKNCMTNQNACNHWRFLLNDFV